MVVIQPQPQEPLEKCGYHYKADNWDIDDLSTISDNLLHLSSGCATDVFDRPRDVDIACQDTEVRSHDTHTKPNRLSLVFAKAMAVKSRERNWR